MSLTARRPAGRSRGARSTSTGPSRSWIGLPTRRLGCSPSSRRVTSGGRRVEGASTPLLLPRLVVALGLLARHREQALERAAARSLGFGELLVVVVVERLLRTGRSRGRERDEKSPARTLTSKVRTSRCLLLAPN